MTRMDPPHGASEADLRELARDWITLVQSELAALAVDREAQETWQTLMAVWAGAAAAMLNAVPRNDAGSPAAPRPAPAAAAPDARDAEIGRLHDQLARLERRLAELERRGD